jgi:transcriptional regulator with XRE-family HTH domain
MSSMPRDRAELGAFLRVRRDQLTPAQAGIEPFPGARRVPGLRRDELAVLAGLSPDYYSRVEQGRQANVSVEVLDALARALRLNEVERVHLRELASPRPAHRGVTVEAAQHPDPGLLRVMTSLDHMPVLLVGYRGEVLAHNLLLRVVLGAAIEPGCSFPRFMFLDPAARQRIVNWPEFAQATIGALRHERGRRPQDHRLIALIDELRSTDPDAERWWNDHAVRDYASVAKRIRHPRAGELTFDIEILAAPHDPEQRLVIYTTEPNSRTARLLPLLASWTDDPATTEVDENRII